MLTAPAGGPALADTGTGAGDFDTSFASFAAVTPSVAVVPGAVDVTAIAPAAQPAPAERILGDGMASYYGRKFDGRRTASGETFDMNGLTAAHRTLPFGSKVRVTNTANGRSVVVRINDRGPFARSRLIDLSRGAAEQIGLVGPGHGHVEIALLDD